MTLCSLDCYLCTTNNASLHKHQSDYCHCLEFSLGLFSKTESSSCEKHTKSNQKCVNCRCIICKLYFKACADKRVRKGRQVVWILMRVRPPTAVARLAETPHRESACLGATLPATVTIVVIDWWM